MSENKNENNNNAVHQNDNTVNNVPDSSNKLGNNADSVNSDGNGKRKRKGKKKEQSGLPFTYDTRVSCLWLKFYAEQCGYIPPNATMSSAPKTDDELFKIQEQYIRRSLSRLQNSNTLPFDYHGIMHNKDTYCDKSSTGTAELLDIFISPATEKPHAHLMVRTVGRDRTGKLKRMTIGAILKILAEYGIIYRVESADKEVAEADLKLIVNNGIIKLNLAKHGDIRAMVYHTHETDEAYETDGKYQYDRNEVYTNIPKSELNRMYDYYSKCMSHKPKGVDSDVLDYKLKFRRQGEKLGDFLPLWDKLPVAMQTTGNRSTFEMMYNDGIQTALDKSMPFPRCCIFMHGNHNTGKSYNTEQAFRSLGLRTYVCTATGTGKFDGLKPTHKAIVCNDVEHLPDILNLSDNKTVQLYKRNKGSAVWTGEYLVITSNLTFDQWIRRAYPDWFKHEYHNGSCITMPDERYWALRSRFIEVDITDNMNFNYNLNRTNFRGDLANVKGILKLFNLFERAFKESIKFYKPYGRRDVAELYKNMCREEKQDSLAEFVDIYNPDDDDEIVQNVI